MSHSVVSYGVAGKIMKKSFKNLLTELHSFILHVHASMCPGLFQDLDNDPSLAKNAPFILSASFP